jgi:uncharacterized protein YuzE
MKLNYYPETDSLYIDLSEQVSVESREVSSGVVLDYDSHGNLVGIDIDHASTKVEIHKLIVSKLPAKWKRSPVNIQCSASEILKVISKTMWGGQSCRRSRLSGGRNRDQT